MNQQARQKAVLLIADATRALKGVKDPSDFMDAESYMAIMDFLELEDSERGGWFCWKMPK
jgi:hypothetical protein